MVSPLSAPPVVAALQAQGIASFFDVESVSGSTVVSKDMYLSSTSQGAANQNTIRVFDSATGQERFSVQPFPGFQGDVRVATADVNGDGMPDIIVAAGPGGGPQVTVYSGKDGSVLANFYAMSPSFTGGLFVAAGDVNGDGLADIVVGAGAGGGPQVMVFSGRDESVVCELLCLLAVVRRRCPRGRWRRQRRWHTPTSSSGPVPGAARRSQFSAVATFRR